MSKQWLKVTMFTALLMGATTAWGGGIFLYEIASPEVGLAAAGWSARAQDPSTLFTNPAGMSRIEQPTLQGGLEGLYLDFKFKADGDTTTSGSDGDASGWLPSGSLFYVHPINEKFSAGIGMVGYFGLSADYGDKWVGRYYLTDITMQGLSFMPSVSYRINERFSLGAGLNAMYAVLEQTAAVNNLDLLSLPDGEMSIEDATWGFGANLGILYEMNSDTRFGLTYLSAVDLEFSDDPKFKKLGPLLDAVLGAAKLSLDLDMTVPQSLMFSGFHQLNPKLAIMGNLGWQDWSEFGKVGVGVTSTIVDPQELTADRNYKDTWHVAVGGQYQINEKWMGTAGLAFDSSMMDDKDRTLDLPAGETWRLGLGGQYEYSKALTLNGGYTLAWMGDLDVDQERGTRAGRVSGSFDSAAIHAFTLNATYRF